MNDTLLITPGEPGGIGPDLVCQLAQKPSPYALCVVADPGVLESRSRLLGLPLTLHECTIESLPEAPLDVGHIAVLPVALAAAVRVGEASCEHASYVLQCLDVATDACLSGHAGAMVTGPINKASIIDAGYEFSGHTEYLAQRTGVERVVMMLASDKMRVALATTHLPLVEVSAAITRSSLEQTLLILHSEIQKRFGLPEPRISVCGLNPHAGEQGHLGREEIEVIGPVCDEMRGAGMDVTGPLPADTAFTPKSLQSVDVVLAMYHDQGLPVIKHSDFGRTVNVTLGLPIVRTSVDHGTALDIAGSGLADTTSLKAALDMAQTMCRSLA
ncbi:MAG: 4-hydroxythreonine-4-phosphate dehydrogenase PdxA [Pseudomonadales bacterium]